MQPKFLEIAIPFLRSSGALGDPRISEPPGSTSTASRITRSKMSRADKEIAVRGKTVRVPTAEVDGRTVIVTGRLPRVASIHDGAFTEGDDISDPREFLTKLADSGIRADMFTFSQKIYEGQPKHPYPFEWDNAAVAPTSSYKDWWDGLPQVVRKNVRRAIKRGVAVDVAAFDDDLVRGIKEIYDETPMRQGRRFWHYGKSLETVRANNSSYLDNSEFIAARCDGELIGFVKFVYVDKLAIIMQIVSKAAHYDKRPMNALIAKAIEVCHAKGVSFLVYSKFTTATRPAARSENSSGATVLCRWIIQYFVPLTLRGRIAFALKLHRGLVGVLPAGVTHFLLKVRSRLLAVPAKVRSWSGEVPAERLTAAPETREVE